MDREKHPAYGLVQISRDVNSNYFHDRITEATEKSIEIAKTEIEAHTQSVIRSLGISSLKALDAAIKSESLKEIE